MTTALTRYGMVGGDVLDGVARFLGIPYAASPTGSRRFRAPEPPEPWNGIRECRAFGPTQPKPGFRPPLDSLFSEPKIPGDDWLTLNVWTPDLDGAAPVMVWIHGGAFTNHNSAADMYDGHAFARDGVVLVSINYRLGVDGFMLLPDAPPNRGLLDQVAALEWVRDNIAAFGGDPANVTIFGESAGGISVAMLLSMPIARGLFARAIAQSGSAQPGSDVETARLVTAQLSDALGFEATAASLAELDLDKLIEAQVAVRNARSAVSGPGGFAAGFRAGLRTIFPVVDGDVLPAPTLSALAAGEGSGVPLLTGTNTEEFRLYLMPTGVANLVTDEMLAGFVDAVDGSADVVAVYRANRPRASAGEVLSALLTDRVFRLPAFAAAQVRASARGPAPTHLYEFGWRSPVHGLGAAHGIDVPFVFDNLAAEGAAQLVGPSAPAALAAEMHATWIRYATAGDPGWQPFDATNPVMTFGGESAEVVFDPRGDELRSWSANLTLA